ncbi:MAG: DUF1890 domain-containing protein [Methanocalculus sp. MSAO_Arc1]|uniref:DUF1890 domain-containing protein n=1 Tax=Methanocalculus TaxID=71151 RepID=UPI000FF4078F|nr:MULTISPECIES: DUF1890 domain-containing protein [unclassified Methanocalculus]MCP1661347.1 threonyl-tRNA synthetase [Methanocalculus sp. AMF5]RQD82100.1 MAG: DUF1890 domain-containing protein [Methanocalculus sp. MSAO_Arc1]
MSSGIAGRPSAIMLSQGKVSGLQIQDEEPKDALIVLGCPEVPVQQALALYLADRLNDDGWNLTIAGNPAVLHLLKVSDPKKVYIRELVELERCIEEVSAEQRIPDLVFSFVHSDAGVSYTQTIRFLFQGRMVVLVFGRNAEELTTDLEIPCDLVMDPAVHNPNKIRRRLDQLMGWVT